MDSHLREPYSQNSIHQRAPDKSRICRRSPTISKQQLCSNLANKIKMSVKTLYKSASLIDLKKKKILAIRSRALTGSSENIENE